jgi:Zn-dependent protease
VLAIFTAVVGFLFAAPGAVYIQGAISRKQNGLISLAGPLTNLALGASFLGVGIVLQSGILAAALYYVGWINLLLAAFNLLPIPPMDGSKVLKWSIPVYVIAFGTAATLAFVVLFGIPF